MLAPAQEPAIVTAPFPARVTAVGERLIGLVGIGQGHHVHGDFSAVMAAAAVDHPLERRDIGIVAAAAPPWRSATGCSTSPPAGSP